MAKRIYAAIDLKSFYASVECVERKLDPLTTNLVVADTARTEKTICLAVSPSLKSFGVPKRPRLFEVEQCIKQVNEHRLANSPYQRLTGSSFSYPQLMALPELAVSYIAAPPRMKLYMEYSKEVYRTYLKHISAEDIHVYSIDEIFADITEYLDITGLSPYEFVRNIVRDIVASTGITATAGIGTNLYLAKIAMDISAKHMKPDKDGVRIAGLDEYTYRKTLWNHRPLTDFWRVGKGYERRLASKNLYTMGDIARCSLGGDSDYYNAKLLYELFGVNAELLIDHAWGYEPCTIQDIKAYRPKTKSLSQGQVLHCPYTPDRAALIVAEMAEALSLDLTRHDLLTDGLTLDIGYDVENMKDKSEPDDFSYKDRYGRLTPKPSHGSIRMPHPTCAASAIMKQAGILYDKIVNPDLTIRRINITAAIGSDAKEEMVQDNLFADVGEIAKLAREERLQKTILNLQDRYGKNSILKGMNLEEDATMRNRNNEVGGHHA